MKKNKFPFFIATMAFFISCTNKTEDNSIFIDGSDNTIELKDCFSSARIIPLIEEQETPMAEINLIKWNQGIFYCLDVKEEALWLFDEEGNQRGHFEHVGHGRNEYLHINDFDFVSDELWLLCSPHKILTIGKDLKVKKEIPLDEDLCFTRICSQEEIYLYSESERSLYTIDKEQNLNRLFSQNPLPMASKDMPVFYHTSDRLFYSSYGAEDLYVINGADMNKFLTFDYEDKESALQRYSESKVPSIEERFQLPYLSLREILDLGENMLVIYTYKKVFRGCIINKTTKAPIKEGMLIGFFPR